MSIRITQRVRSTGAVADRGASATLSASAALRIAVAAGLLFGIIEIGLLGVAKFGLGRYTHLNPQVVWLAPLFYATLLALVTLALLGVRRLLRRLPLLPLVVGTAVLAGAAGSLFLLARLDKRAALLLAAGVAVQAARMAARRPALVQSAARRALPALALIVAAAAIGLNGARFVHERIGTATLPAARAGAPNILLVIWDTVRAASLSLHGYERATTPTLERLARDGALVFDRAFSPAPWTLPSHASMFTGLWPHELQADWKTPLSREPATLAEVLRTNGYRTGGFIANRFYVGEESGLGRGFLHFDVDPIFSLIDFVGASTLGRAIVNDVRWRRRLGMQQKPGRKYADQVHAEFLSWLDAHDGAPFFAFLNEFGAHHPYLPPSPWDTMFGPKLPGRDPSMTEGRSFTERELQAEIDAYDGGIGFQDQQLGLLLEELDDRGLLDNTIVVVTSDHGEEFGEHGVYTHGNTLYDPALHVPLLVWDPTRTGDGGRVQEWVSTRDVAATILDLAGATAGPALPGESLARFRVGSPATAAPDTLHAKVSYARGHPESYPVSKGDMVSLLADPLKYIRGGDGAEELYDLRADPGEHTDLGNLAAYEQALASFRAYLRRHLDADQQ